MMNDVKDNKISKKSKMKKRPEVWNDTKLEIAKELGLYDKVINDGWGGLTASEAGKLGGVLSSRFPGKAPVEED